MLVLSRRSGERIVIGNEIEVEVLSVGDGGVRLGIRAPRETSVHRYEVYAEIRGRNERAAAASAASRAAVESLAARLRGAGDSVIREDESR